MEGPGLWILAILFLIFVVGGGISAMKDVYDGGGILGLLCVIGLIMALAYEGL